MASNWLDKGLRSMEVIYLSPSPPDGWSQELVMMMRTTTTTTMTTTMIMIMIKVIMMMIKLLVVVMMMMMTMMMINDDVMLCVEFLSVYKQGDVYKQGADACHLSEQGTWFFCGMVTWAH